MKCYKGFNKDMTCRGFRFEEGKTYELPEGEEAKLCENGFHACEAPLDCFGYYSPGNSVYHEVELDATDEKKNDDSKRVGKKIKIGARLDVAGICKAQFEYVKEHCKNTENGGDRSALSGGDRSALSGGDGSALRGGYGSALRGGVNSKFRGGMWSVFACEVRNEFGELIGMKTAVVDGKTIKADTWYKLENGEFVEVGE